MSESDDRTKLLYEEAREVLDKQVARTETIETRAGRIFRVTILIVGAILTATSVGIRFALDSQQQSIQIPGVGPYVYFSGTFLAIGSAAVFSVLAYTADPIRIGPSGRDIRRLSEDGETDLIQSKLVAAYSTWIEINQEYLEKSRLWITSSMSCVALAAIYVGLGILTSSVSPLNSFTSTSTAIAIHGVVAAVFALVVAYVMGIHSAIRSYRSVRRTTDMTQNNSAEIASDDHTEQPLEGASFGGSGGYSNQIMLGRALALWTSEHIVDIVPDVSELIQESSSKDTDDFYDFVAIKEDKAVCGIELKLSVNAQVARRLIESYTISDDTITDLYVVAIEYTEKGCEILEQQDHIHTVKVDRKKVEEYL